MRTAVPGARTSAPPPDARVEPGTEGPAEYPALAAGVVVHVPPPGDGDDAPWVVQCGDQRYLRVGRDAGALLALLDGSRDRAALAELLGPRWTTEQVTAALVEFERVGLIADGSAPATAPETRRRVRYMPPLTVHVTLADPTAFLNRLRPVVRRVFGRAGRTGALLLAVFGVCVLAARSGEVGYALGHPLPLRDYVAFSVALLATTMLHELGHGAVLSCFGGKPSRLGIMLFYLTPTFFCDVSDGWRLPRREQRAWTALAGVAVQSTVAGAVAAGSLLLPPGGAREAMLAFAAMTYLHGLLNLIPFVKFDGYIALMSMVDISHLRNKAMADARRWLARTLFGGQYERELPALRWAVPFGLCCMAFPVYLVGTALHLWLGAVLRAGVVGAGALIALLGYLAYRLIAAGVLIMREARSAGAGGVRMSAVTGALLLGTAALLTCVQVPYQLNAGYVRDGDRVRVLLPAGADTAALRTGMPVSFTRSGVGLSTELARGQLTGTTGQSADAPVSAFLPVVTSRTRLPATAYPARTANAPALPAAGSAVLHAGKLPLGKWITQVYGAPMVRVLTD
ncbi:daptide biosynthesis intramembrane metalloprotease [Streptomyces xanthochromogenes]|uniref:daptide biosynthesis intramembrane metalloprotease n=1 Tax=Streptomyces xanthochromogenes TaxID=67384 RepID=UPI0037F7FB71